MAARPDSWQPACCEVAGCGKLVECSEVAGCCKVVERREIEECSELAKCGKSCVAHMAANRRLLAMRHLFRCGTRLQEVPEGDAGGEAMRQAVRGCPWEHLGQINPKVPKSPNE